MTYTHIEGLEWSDEGDIIHLHTLKTNKQTEGGMKLSYKGDVGKKQSKLLNYCCWIAKALAPK